MKRLLLLTFCLLPFAFAQLAPAQVFNYPAQGPTMTQFLSLSNSIPAATNSVVKNGTNVFTGTNTFAAAGLFPANGIALRTLFKTTTNIFLGTVTNYSLGGFPTNNGDWNSAAASSTPVLRVTCPALLSPRSRVAITYWVALTNSTASGAYFFYAGANTNYVANIGNVTISTQVSGSSLSSIFENAGSFTNQYQIRQSGPYIYGAKNFVDTSVPWDFYMSTASATVNNTNHLFYSITITEFVE